MLQEQHLSAGKEHDPLTRVCIGQEGSGNTIHGEQEMSRQNNRTCLNQVAEVLGFWVSADGLVVVLTAGAILRRARIVLA